MKTRLRLLFASIVLFAGTTSGCSRMNGRLSVTIDGRRAEMKSAFVVSHGGRSFRLHVVNSTTRSCSWARDGGVGWIRSGEMHATFDLAPTLQVDGTTRWRIVGGGFSGDSKDGWGVANLGWPSWPVEVTAPDRRCPTRIRVDERNTPADEGAPAVTVEGDFEPACCSKDVPLANGPMTVRIGGESFALARGGVTTSGTSESIHIGRVHDPCAGETTFEDLTLGLVRDTKTNAFSLPFAVLGGLSAPVTSSFRVVKEDLRVVRDEGRLSIQGSFDVTTLMADSASLRVTVEGSVPLVTCANK